MLKSDELGTLAEELLAKLSAGRDLPTITTPSPEQLAAEQARIEEDRRQSALRAQQAADNRALAGLPARWQSAIRGGMKATPDWPAAVSAEAWWTSEKSRVLLLRGGVGVGKSAAAALVHRRASGGATWHRPAGFISAVLHGYADDAPKLGRSLVTVDDVGRDTRTEFDEALCAFLDDYETRLVMTTNLTKEEFRDRYGMRIVDRLLECGTAITIKGESRRPRNGDF